MRSPNTTVLSYGKNPRARHHCKPQYYAERHIVEYKPLIPGQNDIPDLSTKPVPFLPGSLVNNSQLQNRSFQQSIMERSRKSEVRAFKTVTQIEFERLYYAELEKSKNLENQIVQLREANKRLHTDKRMMSEQYEEFIKQLQNEIQSSKLMESKLTNADAKRRATEEELHKLRVELDLIKHNHGHSDEEMIGELRLMIKTLSQEKVDLLNSLKNNKTEITTLKAQISYFQDKEKATKSSKVMNDESLRDQLKLQEENIAELKKQKTDNDRTAFTLLAKDKEITVLKIEVEDLKTEVRILKEILESKDKIISDYVTRIKVIENTKLASTIDITKNMTHGATYTVNPYPQIERLSIRREPVNLEGSFSPPPRTVRTITSSPIIKREYIDARTRCCCCDHCDYCLNRASYKTITATPSDQPLRERYSVYRYLQSESINSPYTNIEKIDNYPNRKMKETRSVTRIDLENRAYSLRNDDNIGIIHTKPYNDIKTERYSNTSVIKIPSDNSVADQQSSRSKTKPLELYKYREEDTNDVQPRNRDNRNFSTIIGRTKVTVNGQPIDSLRSSEYDDTPQRRYVRMSESRTSNVFKEPRLSYYNDNSKFSEYHYIN